MSGIACARLQKWCLLTLLIRCTSSARPHERLRNRDFPAASVRYRQFMITRVCYSPNNNYPSCNTGNYLICDMSQYKPSRFRVEVNPIPLLDYRLNRPLSRNAEAKDFARLTSHPVRGWTGKNKAFCSPGTQTGRCVIKVSPLTKTPQNIYFYIWIPASHPAVTWSLRHVRLLNGKK